MLFSLWNLPISLDHHQLAYGVWICDVKRSYTWFYSWSRQYVNWNVIRLMVEFIMLESSVSIIVNQDLD